MSSMYDSCIANIQFIHGLTWFQLRLHPWLSSSHPSVVWDFRSSQMCYSHREGFISWICERMWIRVTLDAARMCSVCRSPGLGTCQFFGGDTSSVAWDQVKRVPHFPAQAIDQHRGFGVVLEISSLQ